MLKKMICTLSILSVFGFINPTYSCITGGEGSDSCSYEDTTYFFGIPVATTNHSVSDCGEGQYACCTENGAGCVFEEPTIIPGRDYED